MNTPRRSVFLIVGIGAASVVLAAAILAFWFVASHRQVDPASPQLAEAEFSALRVRFTGQQPLLDMTRREPADAVAVSSSRPAPLHSVHTVIFDRRGGDRLIRITVPYWFARRSAFNWLGQLTPLDDTEFDPEAIRLSRDQLERRGPGLVVYFQHPSGGQFISWVD
jgi:hypothetical protein